MIADKLKELRARKGLTREAAAEKIGISARTLANYERGERIPQGEILSSIADFYGVSREELLLDSLRERENLDPQAEKADDGGETPAAEKTSADMAEIADGGGEAALAKKKEKRRNLRAWVIALSVLALFLIVDLVLFFIENLPVENGDSALGILPDWRNLGIALLLLLSVAVTAFGIFLAVRKKRERPRRIFILALCLFVAGMVAAGILGGLLCKDSLFAKKGAQRGFAVYLRLDLQGVVKDYITIAYDKGDTLYVPVTQLDVVSRYTAPGDGERVKLSKLGGEAWNKTKARVKKATEEMAEELIALYAQREQAKGFAFPEDTEWQRDFEARFAYDETPDQLTSTAEIKRDMESSHPMDRLLCGDVGVGKTEVALRAAFKCVMGGKQAAILVPTTILAWQHYNTILSRMEAFPVKVELLSRFRTPAQQKQSIANLAQGVADIVVGTHRLLQKDVKFRDLGLLILDEEQRFGVEHKEKLKDIKRNVDCLTMTATPIPRTLHLSLSGIRDISTIQTPPHARLPVQTYVAEESEPLIRDACIREIARGGQVFLLYNHVESIHAFTKRMGELIPEARITLAHGRMEKLALEKNVFGFYRGEYDILVTTTIIENGIDLPNANTIIVIDSDRLGISQLYQLRGRVGRGKRLAHAYFTYKPERVMTQQAAERLKALMQFTELGSGFRIAMRDLEIRGAGNVLGAEQHGHMDKVGYELYSKILQEEITGVKHESVDLDIRTTAFIPESYVESAAGRMDCYKQIAEIRSTSDYKRVCVSMEETYGPLPPETQNLLIISVLKSYASKFAVRKISVSGKGGALEFASLEALAGEKLSAAMEKYRSYLTLDMTSAPVVRFASLGDGGKTMVLMTKFLKFAATFV